MLATLPPTPSGALAKQIGRRAVERAVHSGELLLVRRGIVAGARCEQDLVFRVRVQQARIRGVSVAAHGTAAELHGLERLGRPSSTVRLLKPSGGAWRDRDVSVGVAQLPPRHVCAINGVPATAVARTVVDLARRTTHMSGVVLADSALRAGCSRSDLEQILADCHDWPGVPNACRAVAFASPLAESVLESISRVAFADAGLPAPQLQVNLSDAQGFIGRVDFLWPEQRVVGEADGLGKYKDILDLQLEKLRQERIERAGWVVARWTWDDIWNAAAITTERVRAALARGADLADR